MMLKAFVKLLMCFGLISAALSKEQFGRKCNLSHVLELVRHSLTIFFFRAGTIPHSSTQTMAANDTIELFCEISDTLLNDNYNSSYLSFWYRNGTMITDNVHVINETTLLLRIENVQPMEQTFGCKFNRTAYLDEVTYYVGE